MQNISEVCRGQYLFISEGKLKQNVVLEGEGLQDKNQEFSTIKHFHVQRGNLSELKLSKGTYQI